MASASSARTVRAENNRSAARAMPTRRGSSQEIPCSAIRPRFAKAVVKTAVSAAMRMSV